MKMKQKLHSCLVNFHTAKTLRHSNCFTNLCISEDSTEDFTKQSNKHFAYMFIAGIPGPPKAFSGGLIAPP